MTATENRLAELAARAWHALTELGAQPHEVLDWLRDESGVEDVPALKRAVYGAAKNWLPPDPDGSWLLTSQAIRRMVADGWFKPLKIAGDTMRQCSRTRGWDAWCDRLDAAIDLCRRQEELPQ